MADKRRITDVDFIESLDGNESFFINQNSTIKQIERKNVFKNDVWDIKNGGTGASDIDTARVNLRAQTKHSSVMVTLSENNWSDNKQTVTVQYVTKDNTIFVSPAPDSYITYTEFEIYCSSQEDGKLTFTCGIVPNVPININVASFD